MSGIAMSNFFSLQNVPAAPDGKEFFETLLRGGNGLRLERIVSHGHTTPEGDWYDQEDDEWVLVLEGSARLLFADGRELRLERGDHALLPAHQKHRVIYTSSPCIWLALFGASLSPA